MRYTDELLDELAATFEPCTCDFCTLNDPDMAYLIAEMSWEGGL